MKKHPSHHLEALLFGSRWLQAPLYLGLVFAQGVYVFKFLQELIHLVSHAMTLTEIDIMLIVLGLIDVVMVANLLIMVTVGGYQTFVSRLDLDEHPDQPEWLSHVNAGVLKVKLATALIGISSGKQNDAGWRCVRVVPAGTWRHLSDCDSPDLCRFRAGDGLYRQGNEQHAGAYQATRTLSFTFCTLRDKRDSVRRAG